MLLGALCEAGVPAIYVEQELQKLPVSGFLLTVRAISKQGLNSCLAEFSAHQSDLPDSLHETACIVARSSLSAYVKNSFNGIVDCGSQKGRFQLTCETLSLDLDQIEDLFLGVLLR